MQQLDDLFAAARDTSAALPDHLMRAILADADAVAARLEVEAPCSNPQAQPRSAIWRQLLVAIGGLPALGGLVAASAVGLWIGLSAPSFLPDPAQLVGLSESISVPYDSYDLALMLGEEVQ